MSAETNTDRLERAMCHFERVRSGIQDCDFQSAMVRLWRAVETEAELLNAPLSEDDRARLATALSRLAISINTVAARLDGASHEAPEGHTVLLREAASALWTVGELQNIVLPGAGGVDAARPSTAATDTETAHRGKLVIERMYERDVDITLAEEFSVNPRFAAWVLTRALVGAGTQAMVSKTYVSAADKSGESDLIVVYENTDGHAFALMIEDKIDAPFQPDQLERYRLRGEKGLRNGLWNAYGTMLCAPQRYIERHSEAANNFDSRLSYEDIADFLRRAGSDPRSTHRAALIEAATPRGARAYVQPKDNVTDAFWNAVYQIACSDYRDLEMGKPDYASRQTWKEFRPEDFPKSVSVLLKGDRGHADLMFRSTSRDVLVAATDMLTPAMSIHQTGKSAVVRLLVDPITVRVWDDETERKVRSALSACCDLVSFFRKYRTQFAAVTLRTY